MFVAGSTNDGCECAELWDPVGMTTTSAGSLPTGYSALSATALADGRVLVMAFVTAFVPDGSPSAAFIWDRASRAFTPAGTLDKAVTRFSTTRLLDGRVLVAGGSDVHDSGLADAEISQSRSASFAPTGSLTRTRVGAPAALAGDGRVLVMGGLDKHSGEGGLIFSAEVFSLR